MRQNVTVDQASLNVVGVSIKTLSIGKKQMTLAVFRQLRHAPIWDTEKLRPYGNVWGHVNYFWDGDGRPDANAGVTIRGRWCAMRSANKPIHLLWQCGPDLCRSCLYVDLGEAASDYPLFHPTLDQLRRGDSRVNEPLEKEWRARAPDQKHVRAWDLFCGRHIRTAEQLFIAV